MKVTFTVKTHSFGEKIEDWKKFEARRDAVLRQADKRLLAINCPVRDYQLEKLQKNLSMQNIDLFEKICKDDKFAIGKAIDIVEYTNVKDAKGLPLVERNSWVIKLLEKMYKQKGAKNAFYMVYHAMHADEIGINKIAALSIDTQTLKKSIIGSMKNIFKELF